LKLQYDEPLSNFAFSFNLRRYNLAALMRVVVELAKVEGEQMGRRRMVGRCSLTL
jgi:hypothetical protein